MSVVLHKVARCSQVLATGQSLLWSIRSLQRIDPNLRLCVTSAYYDSLFYYKGSLATLQPQTGGPLLIRRPSLLFQYAGSYSVIWWNSIPSWQGACERDKFGFPKTHRMNSNAGKVNANLRYVRKTRFAYQTNISSKFIFCTLHQIWLWWLLPFEDFTSNLVSPG